MAEIIAIIDTNRQFCGNCNLREYGDNCYYCLLFDKKSLTEVNQGDPKLNGGYLRLYECMEAERESSKLTGKKLTFLTPMGE